MTPQEVEKSFRLLPGIYVLGCFERGVTVYRQQVRAHNLAWSVAESDTAARGKNLRIAIIGAGVSGLTAAVCFAASHPKSEISIYERGFDLCPLQQGCDGRWLHPRIYSWPEMGSDVPSASLSLMNWKAGRASDVVRQLLDQFAKTSRERDIKVHIGVDHLRVNADRRTVEWSGRETKFESSYFSVTRGQGNVQNFDLIILAVGFGLEREYVQYPAPSYWRNDTYSQPILRGTVRSYIVSGYGDGALVDLARLTIERFRQDTILDELFDRAEVDDVRSRLSKDVNANLWDLLVDDSAGSQWLLQYVKKLSWRVRKDTRVILHAAGADGKNKSLREVFGPNSAIHNRLLVLLLFKAGAVFPRFSSLESVATEFSVPSTNIICRHGADTLNHVLSVFDDSANVLAAVTDMKKTSQQPSDPLWAPGFFVRSAS